MPFNINPLVGSGSIHDRDASTNGEGKGTGADGDATPPILSIQETIRARMESLAKGQGVGAATVAAGTAAAGTRNLPIPPTSASPMSPTEKNQGNGSQQYKPAAALGASEVQARQASAGAGAEAGAGAGSPHQKLPLAKTAKERKVLMNQRIAIFKATHTPEEVAVMKRSLQLQAKARAEASVLMHREKSGAERRIIPRPQSPPPRYIM